MKDSSHNSYHDSAILHATGQSVYINDIPASNMLYGRVIYSRHAHAHINSFNLSKAKKLDGVVAVLSAQDIPGINQMGPVVHDEFCLAEGKVECQGQAIFIIAATSSSGLSPHVK